MIQVQERIPDGYSINQDVCDGYALVTKIAMNLQNLFLPRQQHPRHKFGREFVSTFLWNTRFRTWSAVSVGAFSITTSYRAPEQLRRFISTPLRIRCRAATQGTIMSVNSDQKRKTRKLLRAGLIVVRDQSAPRCESGVPFSGGGVARIRTRLP